MWITALYGGLCGLMLIALAAVVVRLRRRFQVGIGTGGQAELARAVRVQGNFTEYVPLTLVLLGLAEAQGAPAAILHAAGLALVAGRLLHATGLGRSAGRSFGRLYGMMLTLLALGVLALVNLSAWYWAAP